VRVVGIAGTREQGFCVFCINGGIQIGETRTSRRFSLSFSKNNQAVWRIVSHDSLFRLRTIGIFSRE